MSHYLSNKIHINFQNASLFNNKQMNVNDLFHYVADACPNTMMQRNLPYTEPEGAFPYIFKHPEYRKNVANKRIEKGVKP
jgi:hypothetical protein